MNQDVSCKVLQPILADVARKGFDIERVIQGLDLDLNALKNEKNYISWIQLKKIYDNLSGELNYTKKDFIEIGEQIFNAPLIKVIGVIARSLYTLPEFYIWFHNQDEDKLSKQLISCVLLSSHHDDDLNFVVNFKLQNNIVPIPQFYWTSLGVMQQWPRLYGLAPIPVELKLYDDGCEYYFKCPKTNAWLSLVRKIIQWPFTARDGAHQLIRAHNEIYQQNKNLEAENKKLRQYQKLLNEAKEQVTLESQAKSRIIAQISHEVRTPLNGIIATNSLMIDDEKERLNIEHLKTIEKSAQRLFQTFDDIIEFSRAEKNNLQLHLQKINAKEIINNLLHEYVQAFVQKNIELVDVIDGDIPNYLMGDKKRIRQVLKMLLNNVIKYAPACQLQVECMYLNGWLHVQVKDSGPGIDNKTIKYIFESFNFQEDENRSQGLGLGLPLANKLVNLMGGKLSIQGERGTTCQLDIPMEIAEESTVSNPSKILLVEDDMVNQIIFKKILENAGHQVVTAVNGKLGVDATNYQAFDIVLMDLMMPVMDGKDACQLIRKQKNKSELPIVAVSANIYESEHDALFNVGFNYCLHKPVKAKVLLEAVSEFSVVGIAKK